MYDHKKTKRGFVALISVIMVSAVLMLIAVTLSTSNFFERYDILGSELKEKSSANAEACADYGLLVLANNESVLGTTTINISSSETCLLGPIPTSGNPRIFYVQSVSGNYFTTYKISVDPSTISVVSWEEIATY